MRSGRPEGEHAQWTIGSWGLEELFSLRTDGGARAVGGERVSHGFQIHWIFGGEGGFLALSWDGELC